MQTCEHDPMTTLAVQETNWWRYKSGCGNTGLDLQSKSPNMWAWSNNHTQISRKQTNGGMSQLLAIAGLDSQSKDPNMIAWSYVSINQRSHPEVQETNIWRYESAICHCWSGLKVQRCKRCPKVLPRHQIYLLASAVICQFSWAAICQLCSAAICKLSCNALAHVQFVSSAANCQLNCTLLVHINISSQLNMLPE